MTDLTLFVGLDVHKKTISVALVDAVAKADVRHDCEHAGYAAQPVQEAVEGWTALLLRSRPLRLRAASADPPRAPLRRGGARRCSRARSATR